jgi:hypothetical protein
VASVKAQLSLTGRDLAQPAQIFMSVRETRSRGTLYLVLSMAANTKYSVNNFFMPVFSRP